MTTSRPLALLLLAVLSLTPAVRAADDIPPSFGESIAAAPEAEPPRATAPGGAPVQGLAEGYDPLSGKVATAETDVKVP